MVQYGSLVHGYPDVWISGSVDFRISGNTDLRKFEGPEIRISGYCQISDIRMSGYSDIWTYGHGDRRSENPETRKFGFAGIRFTYTEFMPQVTIFNVNHSFLFLELYLQ